MGASNDIHPEPIFGKARGGTELPNRTVCSGGREGCPWDIEAKPFLHLHDSGIAFWGSTWPIQITFYHAKNEVTTDTKIFFNVSN